MPRNFMLWTTPDGLDISVPAYFDRMRLLCHPDASLEHTDEGWVMDWLDVESGEPVVLRESLGELIADDSDVQFPDGQTVYAETQADFEAGAIAKTLFERGRKLFTVDDVPPEVKARFETPELALTWWRGHAHYKDYTGPAKLSSPRIVPATDVPTDRYFRPVWEDTGTAVQVNMPKARGIHMDKIRVVRNAELAAKDVTFMRAVEAGDASGQSTIATEKQTLRDIPQTFDLTTDTPEQLQALWPDGLPRG